METKLTVVRRFEIDAGHRIFGHEGRCRNLHGHRYIFEIEAKANKLDELGRVIDFSEIKKLLGTWLDDNWDHGTILSPDDKELANFLSSRGYKVYLMKSNPTAENMASFLLQDVCPKLFSEIGITIIKVVVFETPNCRAEVSL